MKNAKKSMFITTILMVAVLIVAVSTATFAWYTSNNTATAGYSTLTAATSENFNIAIGWTSDAVDNKIDDLAPATATLNPAVPAAAFADSVAYDTALASFKTAGINSQSQFNADGTSMTPWAINHDAQDNFYVINNNANAGIRVTMTLAVETLEEPIAELKDQLFVAVYVGDTFKGVLNVSSKSYAYGPVNNLKPSNPSADGSELSTAAATPTLAFDLAASSNTSIKLIAWLDGPTTKDANAGQQVKFGFSFGAAAIPAQD